MAWNLYPQQSTGAPHLARFLRDVGYHGCQPTGFSIPMAENVKVRGIPHLAKNERDVGHPGSIRPVSVQPRKALRDLELNPGSEK